MSLEITINQPSVTITPTNPDVTVSAGSGAASVNVNEVAATIAPNSVSTTIDLGGGVGPQGPAGQGVPAGGTAGQILSKIDGSDYNTQWVTPSSGASFTATLTAGETLAARDLIAINGSGQMVKADADDAAKFSVGYVSGAVTSGASGTANLIGGIITGFTGLTPGALYYLSATAGSITTAKPTSGIVQAVGVAISSTSLSYIFSPAIRY